MTVDRIDPALQARVLLTASCTDVDTLPKVDLAGEIIEHDGHRVQVMHNGLYIEEGCYFGPWMTEIIRRLRGHHEPQEELVFHAIVERLVSDVIDRPVMLELGSFWAYYSLWFLRALARGRAIALEPDPAFLETGRVNAHLNGMSDRITFIHGAVGSSPGTTTTFHAASDEQTYEVQQHDLSSLMSLVDAHRAHVVLADIQGAETTLLDRARSLLTSGAIRFLVVSTHHYSISGDALTHQRAVRLVRECGGHVIAEHSVAESFSGDGLIAASFDPEDGDLVVPISYARAKDSLFGELEFDLDRVMGEAEFEGRRADAAVRELQAIKATRAWRFLQPARTLYARAKGWRTGMR